MTISLTRMNSLLNHQNIFRNRIPYIWHPLLVDINRACTCKVRMVNPIHTRCLCIKQGAVIGRAKRVEGKTVVTEDKEDETKK